LKNLERKPDQATVKIGSGMERMPCGQFEANNETCSSLRNRDTALQITPDKLDGRVGAGI
jgi:hypothetical protein